MKPDGSGLIYKSCCRYFYANTGVKNLKNPNLFPKGEKFGFFTMECCYRLKSFPPFTLLNASKETTVSRVRIEESAAATP